MKQWKILILMFVMVAIPVFGVKCDISEDNGTWINVNSTVVGGCINGDLANIQNLKCGTEYSIRCIDDTTSYGYKTITTQRCDGEKQMASLAITLFMLTLIGALYMLPFKVQFSKNPVTQFILKRSCWVIATFMLTMTSAIIATIAETTGIAVTQELFSVMWLLGRAGWVLLVWMFFGTVIEVTKLWKQQIESKRMGNNDEEEDY